MNRAVGVIALTIGTAWLLAGVGSVVSSFEASSMIAEMQAEELVALEKRTEESVTRLEERRAETEKKEDERVDAAQVDVDERRRAVEEAAAPHRQTVEEKQAAIEEAVAAGNARKQRRAEASHARAKKRLESAVRRPTAKLERAETKLTAAKERRDERLKAIDEQIAQVRADRDASLASMKEAAENHEGPSILKPILGAALGVMLLGLGLVLFALKRGPKTFEVAEVVEEEAVVSASEATFPMATEVVRPKEAIAASESPTIGSQIPPVPAATDVTTPDDPVIPTPRVEARSPSVL